MARRLESFTELERADMERRYLKLGQPLCIIALAHDSSATSVAHILKARGVTLRRPGRYTAKRGFLFGRTKFVQRVS
jgi:hypothetical protein